MVLATDSYEYQNKTTVLVTWRYPVHRPDQFNEKYVDTAKNNLTWRSIISG